MKSIFDSFLDINESESVVTYVRMSNRTLLVIEDLENDKHAITTAYFRCATTREIDELRQSKDGATLYLELDQYRVDNSEPGFVFLEKMTFSSAPRVSTVLKQDFGELMFYSWSSSYTVSLKQSNELKDIIARMKDSSLYFSHDAQSSTAGRASSSARQYNSATWVNELFRKLSLQVPDNVDPQFILLAQGSDNAAHMSSSSSQINTAPARIRFNSGDRDQFDFNNAIFPKLLSKNSRPLESLLSTSLNANYVVPVKNFVQLRAAGAYISSLFFGQSSNATNDQRNVPNTHSDSTTKNGVDPQGIFRGQTLLHVAVMMECYQSVKLLLSYGADPQLENQQRRVAIDYAIAMKNKPMLDLLYEYGARPTIKFSLVDDYQYGLQNICVDSDLASYIVHNSSSHGDVHTDSKLPEQGYEDSTGNNAAQPIHHRPSQSTFSVGGENEDDANNMATDEPVAMTKDNTQDQTPSGRRV